MDWLTILLIVIGLFVAAFVAFCWISAEEPVEYMGRHIVTKQPDPPKQRRRWRIIIERH